MPTERGGGALVLFSGGQDSTTCLAWALDRYAQVETLGFDYGQRHRVELDVRPKVLTAMRERLPRLAARLGADHMIDLGVLGQISDTALTRETEIAMQQSGLPNTFVPGRNLVFLTFAGALAYRRGARHIVAGMCETDFSGYPDCRDDTMKAMQLALNLGMDTRFVIDTPLMWIDKAATWALARTLGGDALIDIIRRYTHTCYNGDRAHFHDWGYGCGSCPACMLRAAGYQRYLSVNSA
jgi:7-cyano-7-deazaguanine synthase